MEHFLRVKGSEGVTYVNVNRVITVEIRHEAKQAIIVHDGPDSPLTVEGESYDELITFLGHAT